MGGKNLLEVKEEKDLGVLVNSQFKVSSQCAAAAKKGYQVLGMISRTFVSKKKEILVKLYKSLVRPHVDYCIQAWRPHLQKDKDVLERVQRRATRMVAECKGLGYEDRLKVTELTTLETRRIRADLIEVYKILKTGEGLDEKSFFERCSQDNRHGASTTRGHSLKLIKKRCRLNTGLYSFGNRVVNDWNMLPERVIEATSLETFKGRLDYFLRHTRGLI
jgi:ribonucleases P/MRP protein subunit RPP40